MTIYAIYSQDDPTMVKLGRAKTVGLRRMNLQTGNPKLLEILWTHTSPLKDWLATYGIDVDIALERFIHNRFRNEHPIYVRGEWYDFGRLTLGGEHCDNTDIIQEVLDITIKDFNKIRAGQSTNLLDMIINSYGL